MILIIAARECNCSTSSLRGKGKVQCHCNKSPPLSRQSKAGRWGLTPSPKVLRQDFRPAIHLDQIFFFLFLLIWQRFLYLKGLFWNSNSDFFSCSFRFFVRSKWQVLNLNTGPLICPSYAQRFGLSGHSVNKKSEPPQGWWQCA